MSPEAVQGIETAGMPNDHRWLRRMAWAMLWVFLLYVVGHMVFVLYGQLPNPQAQTRLYYTESPGGGIEPWGMVYTGWAGTVQAMAQLAGHIVAMVMALRARGMWRTVALGVITVWAAVWVIGVGRVLLATGAWFFFGPWFVPPVLGALGGGSLVFLQYTSRAQAAR